MVELVLREKTQICLDGSNVMGLWSLEMRCSSIQPQRRALDGDWRENLRNFYFKEDYFEKHWKEHLIGVLEKSFDETTLMGKKWIENLEKNNVNKSKFREL